MFIPIFIALIGIVILVIATDQFVTGASRVAEGLRASSVLVGAVILGCGIGLPELALAFHGERHSPLRIIFGLDESGNSETWASTWGLLVAGVILVLVFIYPILFPDRMRRHSPLILLATILFAALLRGSLDRIEGIAMLTGFVCGIAWVIHRSADDMPDPWAPIIDDDYATHGAYIDAPLLTPLQLEVTRSLAGLAGTLLGAQLLAQSCGAILRDLNYGAGAQGLVLVAFGSVLPHLVVAIQALRQHHEGLAVGNLIGSNLFHSLAVGGLVAIIKPYQLGGAFRLGTIAIVLTTAAVTYLLLRTDEEAGRGHGVALLVAYVGLAAVAVP